MGKKSNFSLSPNVRLRMTLDHEMDLDKEGHVFNDALHQKYINMHREALSRQNAQLKTVALADVVLALLLNGKNITIPGTEIGIREIPAAIEVLTAFSAFGFLMLSLTFLNAQFYQALTEQFSFRRARAYGIDPDFINMGDVYTEIFVKAFRAKLNIYGVDFFDAGVGYRFYYSSMMLLLLFSMFSVIALHFVVVGSGIVTSFSWDFPRFLFCGVIVLVSVVSLLVNLLIGFSFDVRGGEALVADSQE